MDRQEGTIAAGAVAMDGAGDQLLAGAAFAGDEHAGIARGHQSDALEDVLHRRTAADNLFGSGGIITRLGRGFRSRPTLEGTVDAVDGLLQIERLGQVIEGAALHRAHRRRQIAKRRHDDDRQVRHKLADARQSRQAVHARQTYIEDQHIGTLPFQQREPLFGGSGHRDRVPFAAEGALERPAHRFLIVNNENMFHRQPLSAPRLPWFDPILRRTASQVHTSAAGADSSHPILLDNRLIQFDAKSRFLRHANVAVEDGETLLRQGLPQRPLLDAILEVMRVRQGGDEVQARRRC